MAAFLYNGPEYIDTMTAAFVSGGFQMPELIELVVLSDAFRMRRGELEEMP